MALSHPRTDILTSVAFQDQKFQLMWRQEISRTAGGVTLGKDLGPSLWSASYTTIRMDDQAALAYEADLDTLEGVIFPFEAGDLRRLYPLAHPTGDFNDTGVIEAVNGNNRAMSLSGLDPGFVLSKGDYLSFDYGGSRALHRLAEGAVANGFGVTPQFEVRPHLRPGWVLDAGVKLKRPSALFTLVPGSVSQTLNNGESTVISFQAMQYLA